MKTHRFLLSVLFASSLASCYVTPRPHAPRAGARSIHSPGGRAITPMERADRSPFSPGGRAITPRERRHRWY
ncbi:MAG: hypothetical protein JNM65_13975 [Verrucomicrobiaceae bacterium]|nr:hypothetical protein [Verrucomicrobiaceae bacterium]